MFVSYVFVISQVCQLSGTEVSFLSHYNATMSKIRQSGCTVPHRGLDNESEPSIKDLARHLTADSSSSSAVEIVDRFLSSSRLPSFDEISSGSRGRLQIDSCQLAALVTFDLAICSRAVAEVSRELLQIAQGKMNSAGTKHCPQTCTNLKSFIDDMIKLLHVMTTGQSVSVHRQQCDSLASLLASSVLPLEAGDYRIAMDGLVWIEKAMNQTRDGLAQHTMHPMTSCHCSCTPDELLAHLADVCHTAIPRGGLLPVLHRYVVMSFMLDRTVELSLSLSLHPLVPRLLEPASGVVEGEFGGTPFLQIFFWGNAVPPNDIRTSGNSDTVAFKLFIFTVVKNLALNKRTRDPDLP